MAIDFQEDDKDKLDFQLDFQEDEPSSGTQQVEPSLFDFLTGSARKGYKQNAASKGLQKAVKADVGGLEAGLGVATGLAGIVGGLAPAAIESINNKTQGKDDSFEQNYANKIDRFTYEPRTELGQDMGHATGEFINRNLVPLGPMAGTLAPVATALSRAGKVRAAQRGNPTVNEAMRRQAEREAAVAEPKPGVEPDLNLAAMHDDAVLQRLRKVDEGLNSGRIQPYDAKAVEAERADIAGRVARMNDTGIQERLTEINDALNRGEDRAALEQKYNVQYAEEQLRRRQEQMEMDVKRQTTLDFNAAERGRQERAPVPGLDEMKQRQAAEERVLHEEIQRAEDARLRDEMTAAEFQKELTDLTHKIEQLRAQHAIERRQAEMEIAVKRQTSLDLNAAERGRQEAAPVQGVDEVINRANQFAESDPRFQAAEAKLPGVEERAVDAGTYGDMHSKFMEQTLDLAEKQVQGLKDEIADTVRKNPTGIRIKGLGQRGAVGNLGGKKRTLLDDLRERFGGKGGAGEDFIPKDAKAADIVSAALSEGGEKRGSNMLASGAALEAAKRASALIKGVADTVQNHKKKADLLIREHVFPVEKALRTLGRREIRDLKALMLQEMLQGKRFHPDDLANLSKKQFEAYTNLRAMFEDTMRIQNEQRALDGKPPIKELEAYMSSRWDGDMRRPIYQAVLDKGGNPKIKPDGSGTIEQKLVWYLAADTKMGLDRQMKALMERHPDLIAGKDHTVRQFKRQTDLQSMYTTIVDILGRNDEAVARIKQAVEDQAANEAASFLAQEKHFKEKSGVRGFVGDRPGKQHKTGEAIDFFQQQIQYAKNAYNWSEMQAAGRNLKEVFSDKTLAETQPNNMKYAKDYFKNNIGFGEATAIAHMEDALKDLGVPLRAIQKTVGGAKSYFILNKLMVNTGYSLAGILQVANVLPHLMRLYGQGIYGNPLTAAAAAVAGGATLGLGHYASLATGGKLSKGIGHDSAFYKKAFKYAEDNGVTARSLMDESPIGASFNPIAQAGKLAGNTLSIPEVAGRSMAYMAYVEFLRSSGKFKGNDMGLFQAAESLVNQSMVDYRGGERPMVFSKLGTAGDFLNTLQTYPMNWYNQWNLFARDAANGNPMPLLAAFAVQYAMAGMMGIPGFQDMDKLYQLIKDHLPADLYGKVRDNEFWNDPKVWMLKHWGNAAVNGWVSDKSGIGITSRVAAPGLGDMIQAPGGPMADIGKQAVQLGSAALDPTNTDKWAQFGMSAVPPGTQGMLEQAPFMQGKTFEQDENGKRVYQRPGAIDKHEGIVRRSPEEERLRRFGLRSTPETVERELGYRAARDQRVGRERAKDIIDDVYAAAKRGDTDRVKELYSTYVKLTGSEISKEAWENKVQSNFTTTLERTGKNAGRLPIVDLKEYTRLQAIMDKVRSDYQRTRSK